MRNKTNRLLFTAILTIVALVAGHVTAEAQVTISTAEEWNTFASNVNSGTTYSGQTVTLTANITITTGAGSSSANSFRGTFEGGGHTLTLNLTHNSGGDAWIAPFRFINGATIKHLHTAGTITTDGKMAGGIVGDSWGTSTIQSCRSSVTISSSISGDGTHGGLVGRVNNGTLTINDCLFDGSITGAGTNSCGGFVGWKEASLVLNRCLQAGDLSGIGSDGGSTFSRFNSGSVDFSTCYYRTAYGTPQGTQTAATGSTLQGLLGAAWEVSGDDVLPIMDVMNLNTATISGVNAYYICTGNEIKPEPTVTTLDGTVLTKDTHYSVTWSGDGTAVGDYTVTVTGISPYYGSQEVAYTLVSASGALGGYEFTVGVDIDGSYYVVDSKEALNALAAYVNAGNNASGMRFKQTADIDMQGENYTTIGNDNDTRPFSGTYDGDGFVIKNINYIDNGSFGIAGLFGLLEGSVMNVNLHNCNFTAREAGGIAGRSLDGSSVQNCNVLGGCIHCLGGSGSGHFGGIVGYFYGGTVDGCFTTTTFWGDGSTRGPVVGWNGGTVTNSYYVNYPSGSYSSNSEGTQVTVYTITLGDGITTTGNFRTVGKTAANTYHFGKEGDVVTLTATPVEGKTAIYSVNGTPIDGNTFTMPAGDVTVSVEFVMTWADLKTAMTAGGTRTVTLTNNVIRDVVGGITVTGTVTLDLNGYTLDGNSPTCYNPLFFVNDGVSLTITDSQTGGNLCKAGINPTVSVSEGGSLTLAAGTINGSSWGVYVNGSFTMTGGTITAATISGVDLNGNGSFTMTGGTITGNNAGVNVSSATATFTVSGNVDITGNTTKDVNMYYNGSAFNPIHIGGALASTARIGINIDDYTANAITGDVVKVITDGLSGHGTKQNFVLNGRDGHTLIIDGCGELAVTTGATINNAPETTVLSESKYVTTFYNGTQDYRLLDGAKAYTVNLDGEKLVFHLIGVDGSVIPHGNAVVIVSESGSISLTELVSTSVVPYDGNILSGSDTDVAVSEGKVDGKTPYVLNISGGVLGFYKFSGSTIPAGKAYYLKSE